MQEWRAEKILVISCYTYLGYSGYAEVESSVDLGNILLYLGYSGYAGVEGCVDLGDILL